MTNIQYDIDALKANMERCDKNIRTFEKAIDAEEVTKRDLRRMIRTLEEKQVNVSPN